MCKQFHSMRECSAERQFLFRGIALRSQLFCIKVEECASKNAHMCVAGVMCKNVLLHRIVISRKLSLKCRKTQIPPVIKLYVCFFVRIYFFFRLIYLWHASSGYILHVWEKLFTHNARTYVCTYNPVFRPINRRVVVRAAPLCHFEFEQQSFTVENSNRNFAPSGSLYTGYPQVTNIRWCYHERVRRIYEYQWLGMQKHARDGLINWYCSALNHSWNLYFLLKCARCIEWTLKSSTIISTYRIRC